MLDSLASLAGTLLDKLPLVDVLLARSKSRQEHDRTRFKDMDSVLSEAQLTQYIDEAINHELEDAPLRRAIDRYLEWTQLSGNQFLIKALTRARKSFDRELRTLRHHCLVHFFPARNGSVLQFRPDQNPRWAMPTNEERAFFDRCEAELDEKARRCSAAYRAFRQRVKSVLYV